MGRDGLVPGRLLSHAFVILAERLGKRARVRSKVERSEPKGNLDPLLARWHAAAQNDSYTQPIRTQAMLLNVEPQRQDRGIGFWVYGFSKTSSF
jgi:hypothetical protein